MQDIHRTQPASPLHPTLEMQLASDALGATSERELEQFVGDVFHTVGQATGRFVQPDAAQALGQIVKDAARRALPLVGHSVGVVVGSSGPGEPRVSDIAASLLGLELEGLSPPDQEFEAARALVRFAGAAANRAALAPAGMPPDEVAHGAARAAARSYAPGIADELERGGGMGRGRAAARIGRGYRTQAPASYGGYGRAGRGVTPFTRGAPPRRQAVGGRGYTGRGVASKAARAYTPTSGSQGGRAAPTQSAFGGVGGPRQRRWGYPRYLTGGYGAPSGLDTSMIDWSSSQTFLADTPPTPPSDAPGRFIFRGRRSGRRRWTWIPDAGPAGAGPPGPAPDAAPDAASAGAADVTAPQPAAPESAGNGGDAGDTPAGANGGPPGAPNAEGT